MFNVANYFQKPVDTVRGDLLGAKVIDIESNGRVIYLEDEEGRTFSLDTTGNDGVVVTADLIDKEKIEHLELMVEALLETLGVKEEDVFKKLSHL